jgi:osmoprotectant transport system permease protein
VHLHQIAHEIPDARDRLSYVGLAAEPLRIGSKRFTEAYILAQVVAQTAAPHAAVEVKAGLGNTAIVYEALRSGSIDLYPEYTGTIALEILKDPGPRRWRRCARHWRSWAWASTSRSASTTAMRWRCARTAPSAGHPQALRPGPPPRTEARPEQRVHRPCRRLAGPGEALRPGAAPQGLDHGLAYDAVGGGQVDVIDIYTTDAKIGHLGLRVLADDAGHFPRYDAVLLYRLDVPQRFPQAWAALQRLAAASTRRR